jgi:5,10-methylenetetrahydromethanopterin reductase
VAVELWTASVNIPGQAQEQARQATADGYDGISMGDTVTLGGDPYVGLTAAAFASPTLKLLVGVTNSVTRHPALTAAAIVSVQIESKGRAVLGIGRGDSAVSKFGLKASTAAELEQYLVELQGYLRGEKVHRDGKDSALEWLKAMELPKVPVDVAATGPKVIAAGARQAERITFNFGGDAERIAEGIKYARQTRKDAGLPADGLSFGAYLPVAPHPDIKAARELVKEVTGIYARFQAMPGHPTDQVRPEDAETIKVAAAEYSERLRTNDGHPGAYVATLMKDEFVDRFAVVGTAEQVIEKLARLRKLGLDRLVVVGPNRMSSPERYTESRRLLAEVVIPELKRLD